MGWGVGGQRPGLTPGRSQGLLLCLLLGCWGDWETSGVQDSQLHLVKPHQEMQETKEKSAHKLRQVFFACREAVLRRERGDWAGGGSADCAGGGSADWAGGVPGQGGT